MPTPRARTSSPAAASPPSGKPAPWRTALLVLSLIAYSVLFFCVPIKELVDDSRIALLSQKLLLVDEVVAGWFGDPPEIAIGDRLSALVPAILLLTACAAIGSLLLAATGNDRDLDPTERLFFACTIGYSALSLYMLLIGLAGLLDHRWLVLAPCTVAVIAAGYQLWHSKPSPLAGEGRVRGHPAIHPHPESCEAEQAVARRWLWWVVPFTIAIALGGTLTPLDFDVREYHLQAPKEFYLQGAIGFLPHNVYANMPLGSEMLALAGMVALDDWHLGALVGKTAIALCAPLTALGLWAAGRRLVGPLCGTVAAIVFISTPWIARVSSLGLVEGVSALYLWATAYATILWWRSRAVEGVPRVLLAGFCAGSAVACKYPNVVFVLIPATLVVAGRCWWTARRAGEDHPQSVGRRLLPVGAFIVTAALACAPWFAKNWILTGNPTYPLLYSVFDGQTRTTELDAQWNRAHRPPAYSAEQAIDSLVNFAWRSSWQNPLLLPLAILGVLGTCYRRLAWGLAGYTLYVLAAWWLFTHRIDRFWVPLLPVPAFLAGLSATQNSLTSWRWPVKAFLSVGLALNLLLIISGGGGDTSYFVSVNSMRADLTRDDPWHIYLNEQHARQGFAGAVLTVGDAVVFDFDMPVLYSTVFDDCLFEQLMKGRTAGERRAALAERNVAYVFVHWGEIRRYRSPGNYGFTDYITPELFDELVREQVLDPPLPKLEGYAGRLYPVHGASIAAPAVPPSPDRSGH